MTRIMAWGRLVLLAALVLVVAGEQMIFVDHDVLRVVPQTMEEMKAIRDYLDSMPSLDVWRDPTVAGQPVDVRVSPEEREHVMTAFAGLGLKTEFFIKNLQQKINEQLETATRGTKSKAFGWTNYYRLDDIYKWMDDVAKSHPTVASTVEAGDSFEGRKIKGLKLKFGENKPIVLIEAGMHAREWITPATATFLANEILTSEDEKFQAIARSFEWHIFPSTNPDGYEYTHTKNRMWRKTRSTSYAFCTGADANRNWPHHWMEAGASKYPCDETFAGKSAGSEKETQALKSYLDAIVERTKVYISIHSYSQLLMFPWGYTSKPTPTHENLMAVAKIAAEALKKRYNTQFLVGPIASTIYPAAGSTVDYAYSKGVQYPYAFELRDTGRYGFLLPASQIIPAAQETTDAIIAILDEANKRA